MTVEPVVEAAVRAAFDCPVVDLDRVGGRRSKGVHIDFLDLRSGREPTVHLVAKRYLRHAPNPRRDRPGLGRIDDRAAKPTTEWAGLNRLWEALPDDAVRPWWNAPEDQILLLERFRGPDLRTILFGEPAVAEEAVQRAAELFAAYHRFPGGEPLRTTIDDVSAAFDELVDFTSGLMPRRLADRLPSWWRDSPAASTTPVVGLGHGDCAPRNIVTDIDGRIAIIDCLARNRVPVHDDLATFTTSLRVQLRTQWPRRPRVAGRTDGYVTTFVDRYVAAHPATDPAPLPGYEVLALLDRLASIGQRRRSPAELVHRALVVDEIRRITRGR